MANGSTIKEIKTLLSVGGTIPTKTALRLSLDLQLQIFEKQALQDAKNKEIEDRLGVVEKNSLVMWVQKNPKLSIFIVSVYVVVANVISVKEVLAQALGVK